MTSSKPWMPLYIADYRRDTAHLSAAEHGAYLQLIMHYWTTGGLPKEDAPLARIASMTASEWKRSRRTVAAFFTSDWQHKRIDAELTKAAELSDKRRASALQKHSKRDAIAPAIAEQLDTHAGATSQSHSVPNGTGATAPPDPKKELFDRGRQVLGRDSGGLISKLLKACGPEDDPKSIAKARARIEDASTKANPAEWLGRILAPRAGSPVLTETGQPWPEGIV
jgi:uncharacterized protein YdaU (DUF1376 family)